MPTAGELRLEQAHQRDLATIGAGVMSGVANLALGADPAAISTWFFTALDAIMARVSTGYAQARRSGTGYIQSRATMAGADVDLRAGSLSTAQARTSLEVTGPVAFKRAIAAGADDEEALLSMATQMSGSAQRLAIAGDRDVLEQTIAHGKGVVGYRRVLGGPGCGFCAMLASRGAVYLSRESASMTRSGLRFHDHCVPAGTLVAGPGTEKAFRRWYEGELVVFRAGDNELSITPNHPVLTPCGWVPAGLLREGDYVVERPRLDRESADVPDEYDVPAPIEDVWRSLRVNGLVQVPVAAEDFHGDGQGQQADVDVVAAYGLLAFVGDTALCHEHAQQVGTWAGPRLVTGSFAALSDADLVLLGALAVANGLVGVGGQGPSFVGGHSTHPDFAGLAAVARLNASFREPAHHYAPSHAQASGDAQDGFAATVGLDRLRVGGPSLRRRPTEVGSGLNAAPMEGLADDLAIQPDSGRRLLETLAGRVQVRRVVELHRIGSWSGHVYNLQTTEGWYSANKIVVHNCRCHVEPMFRHEPDPPDVQRLQRQWQRITAGQTGQGKAVAWRNYWENDLVDRSKLRLAAAKAGPPSPVPGLPHPAPGVVVRSGLDAKRTLVGLQEAWAAEAKRITGRNLSVEIPAGTSLQTAKEYAEGVLRGLERFPDAAVSRIRFGQMAADQYAEAGSREITFNARWASMRNRPELVSGLQNDIAGWAQGRNGWSTRAAGTPMSLSLHEFAHIIDIDNLGERIHSRALSMAQRRATLEGIPVDDLIARDISVYATSDAHELIAEAFADVMLRGQAASPLAREIFDLLEAEYFRAGGRITPAFGTFPAKAAPNLAKMTVPQLRALAAERGVTLPAKALKADIVRALEEAGPAVPRIAVESGSTRWLGKVDLTSMSAAEAERMGALVQAKSRRDILDEIVQLRADGASNRALVNRITGRSKLPNDFGVHPQVDDAFRDELLAAVDNGTIDDVVRRHLAALDTPKRVVKPRPGSTIGYVELGPTQIQQALGEAPLVRRPAGDFADRDYLGPDGAIAHRGETLPAGFKSDLADIRRGRFELRPGLTPDESYALDQYALSRVADPLNTALRQGKTSGFGTAEIAGQTYDLDEIARRLDSAIEAGRLAADTTLYRGALMRPADVGKLQVGAITRESGFLSTTSASENAFQIINWRKGKATGGRSPVLFEILAPRGTRAAAGHIQELEVLLARGQRLRVVGITRPTRPGDVRHITLELLPDAAVVEKPLAKRTVTELRALAKERNITLPPKATKAQIVEALQAPPLTPAQIRAAEQKALRDAARERNRQIEQATGTARLLAEVDELLVKKAEARVIRQRLDPALIDPAQVFANADPAVREALATALASGDMAKVRAAVTRLTTKAKIKVVGGKAGAKVKFDPATMESVGVEIADGAPVTVVTRGASVTLPDGTVVQVRKAQVTPVAPKLGAKVPRFEPPKVPAADMARLKKVLETRHTTGPLAEAVFESDLKVGQQTAANLRFVKEFQRKYPGVLERYRQEAAIADRVQLWRNTYRRGTPLPEVRKLIEQEIRRSQVTQGPVVIRRGRESTLLDILESGRLKTQFETGTSGGTLGTEMRSRFESITWGYERDLDPTKRVIYGYVSPGGVDAENRFWPVSQYGPIRIVLKDSVRERTSITFGDSLMGRQVPTPMEAPDYRSFDWSLSDEDLDLDFGSQTFQQRVRYIEAQIHGGVTADDIAEVVFTPNPNMPNGPSPETIRALEKAGIPWRMEGDGVSDLAGVPVRGIF